MSLPNMKVHLTFSLSDSQRNELAMHIDGRPTQRRAKRKELEKFLVHYLAGLSDGLEAEEHLKPWPLDSSLQKKGVDMKTPWGKQYLAGWLKGVDYQLPEEAPYGIP